MKVLPGSNGSLDENTHICNLSTLNMIRDKNKNRKWLTIAFWLWVVVLYILTVLPGEKGPEKFSQSPIRWDYIEHFFLFSAIPVLFFLSDRAGFRCRSWKSSLMLAAAGLIYAVVAEVQQIWVPGRAFNPVDLILNLSGLLAGIPAGWFIAKKLYGK